MMLSTSLVVTVGVGIILGCQPALAVSQVQSDKAVDFPGVVGTYGPSSFEEPNFSYEELYNLTTRLWDNFVYPANVAQAQSINSSLFAEDIIGRVDITRVFVGRELNTEYLFGLFAQTALNPSRFSFVGTPINHTTTHFAATKNVASNAQIIYVNLTSLGLIVPMEVDAWFTFNANGELSQYDVTFRWFEQVLDLLSRTVSLAFNLTHPQITAFITQTLAGQICATEAAYCNGTNQQYANASQCVDYLTQHVRIGKAYELGGNTLLCRSLHEVMLPYRPAVHCPHVGRKGGGMCTDNQPYEEKVLQDVFTNADFVPVVSSWEDCG